MGMPVRREVRHISKDQIRQEMNIPRHVKVLVIVGGSQGAQPLNDWASNSIPTLVAEGVWPIIVTGPGKGVIGVKPRYVRDNGETVPVGIVEFHDNMHELLSCADLVVSRAGAGTIAELIACLCPSILIPYPYAADDHQLFNAVDLEQRGGCVVIPQVQLDGLLREVMELIYNDWMLSEIRRNLRLLNRGDAGDKLVKDLRLQASCPHEQTDGPTERKA
jgi:UDP-N-acetylglucosamine--N-acetylmuramyl-(pentapeptide) pyrophosphoryl-undecaprenol N-acetylglucosamine transferase